jgi:hypothetical protein
MNLEECNELFDEAKEIAKNSVSLHEVSLAQLPQNHSMIET